MRSRLIVSLAAIVVVVAACSSSGSSSAAKTATSAADLGGVDKTLRGRQDRGAAQPHRHPSRLGELRSDDHGLHGEVRDQDPVGPARRRQRGRDQGGDGPGRHRPPARRLRPHDCSRLGQHRQARTVQGGHLGRYPRRQQGVDRGLDQRLHRLPEHRLRREPRRHHQGRRPRRCQVQGQGRPQRRPAQGRRGLQRCRPGRTGQRRIGRQHRARCRLLQEADRLRQPDPGRPGPGDDRLRHDPDRHRLDLQRGPADRCRQAQGDRLEGRRSDGRAARRGLL